MPVLKKYRILLNTSGLAGRFISACGWVTLGNILLQILRLTRIAVLTWLLAPDLFGLVALVWSVISILKEFSDIGIRHALIQNPKGSQTEYLNTAWSFNLLRNILLAMTLYFISPVIAHNIYNKPALLPLLRISCLILFFEGLTSTGLINLEKQLRFKKIKLIQLTSQLTGVAGAIILAWWWKSAMVLVISEIIIVAITCALSYTLCSFQPKFQLKRTVLRELAGYGIMVYLVATTNILCHKIDILILAKVATDTEIGIYSLAMTLIWALVMVFSQLTTTVGFPTIVQIQDNFAKIRQALAEILKATQTLAVPLFIFLAAFSADITNILPARYHAISIPLCYLTIFGLAQVLRGTISPSLYAIKQVKWCMITVMIQLAITVILIIPMYEKWQLSGICWAMNIAIISTDIILWMVSLKIFNWNIRQWFRDTAIVWWATTIATATFAMAYLITKSIIEPSADASRNWAVQTAAIAAITVHLFINITHYYHKMQKKLNP